MERGAYADQSLSSRRTHDFKQAAAQVEPPTKVDEWDITYHTTCTHIAQLPQN
jgi:hypothetical protein